MYDAVSTALRRWPQVHLEQAPRLADFARWVVAAEPSLGVPEGAFLEAYVHNRTVATEVALEAAPVASAIQRLLDRQPTRTWAGTATQLLNELEDVVGMNVARSRGWPRNPQLLGNEVRNVEQTLREVGVTVEYERRNRERRILLARTDRPEDRQGRG